MSWIVGGVTMDVQASPSPSSAHDRPAFIRTHTGHVARQEGHSGMWNTSGVVGPYPTAERQVWKLFLRGVGETWKCTAGSNIGSRGSVPNAGGTYTVEAASGKFAGRFAVGTGSFVELPTDIDTAEGWCFDFWRKEAAGSWEHYVVFGTGTTVGTQSVSKDGAAVVTASTLGLQHFVAVASDGDVQLKGLTSVGGNIAVDFSEPHLRPFTIFDDMATDLSGETLEPYALPSYRFGGAGLGLTPAGAARTIKAEIDVQGAENIMLGGNINDRIALTAMQTR